MRYFGSLGLCLALVTFAACDDADGGSEPMEAGVDPDRGIVSPDTGVDLGAGGAEADMGEELEDMGAGGGDAGPGEPDLCDRNVGYGLQWAPRPAVEGSPRFSPQLVWTGAEWGALWQAPSEDNGVNDVMFRRFNSDGDPVGEAVALGVAKVPQQAIMFNGAGYVAVWISSRTAAGGIDGVKIQLIGADGTPAGAAVDVPATFDVAHLNAAWAPLAGGMVVYTRGRNGQGGLFALPVNEGGTPGVAARLSESEVRGPAVAFGDGSWGVSWLDRASENPADLMFVVINDRGEPLREARRNEGAGAQGATHVAYGQSIFGVGWSKVDAMGSLAPFITLFDSAGDLLATPPIPGPEGFGLVTDVAWLDPNSFAVAWQDSAADGATVGMTRVNTNGVVQPPFRLALEGEAAAQDLHVAGNISRAGAFFVYDPAPLPGGAYSAEAHLRNTVLAPCQ